MQTTCWPCQMPLVFALQLANNAGVLVALLRRSNWVAHWGEGAEQLTATLSVVGRAVHTTVDQMGQLHKQCKLSMPPTRCNDVTLPSLLLLQRQSTHAHQATQHRAVMIHRLLLAQATQLTGQPWAGHKAGAVQQ
jgi:hypothetical protein